MYGYGQRYEIIHVNGRQGAEALAMMPNSNALLWDDTAPIIWLVQTDGAGYKSINALDATVHIEQEPISANDIMTKLLDLENRFKEMESKYESSITNA